MATYPDLIQMYGTMGTPVDGSTVYRSEGGKPRIVNNFTQRYEEFTVIHEEEITSGNKETLETFYDDNRLAINDFTFKADNQVYQTMFAGPPVAEPIKGERWKITVRLVVV